MKTDTSERRIGVVMGGLSAEREVSLETGAGVLHALASRGHDCVGIDWAQGTSLPALLAEHGVAVVWNALHGTYGEDGAVQGLCACMGIPCTGSGVTASALAMDKVMTKRVLSSQGVRTPHGIVIAPDADVEAALAGWDMPLVVKPALEGSSVGVTVLARVAPGATPGGTPGATPDDRAALREAVARARAHRGPTIVERYIAGTELHVGILEDRVLGSIEVRPRETFYDYEAKYKRDDTEYLIPPAIEAAAVARGEELSLQAYRALGCSGYGRVDLRIDHGGLPYVLEVNTLPGMTSHSLLPKIAAHGGIDYPTLCERILALAQ